LFIENISEIPLKKALPIIQDRIINKTSYFGIKTLKNPFDFWIYQEIIFQTKPDHIIEIGSYCGGSTLALAHICDNMKKGMVISLDLENCNLDKKVTKHPRIIPIEGDACESFEKVAKIVGSHSNTMIIEDSSHTYEHTLAVLKTFSVLVKPGNFFIVEDSICHHGLNVGPNPGSYEAIETFLAENKDFEADRSWESFLITWNPKGFLKRCR